MLFTKKTTIIICIVAAIVLGAIAGYVVYDLKLRAPEKDKTVADTVFFDFDANDVSVVYLQSGSTGKVRVFDTAEDLDVILPLLSAVEYDTIQTVEETQGWSYSVRIYLKSKDGAAYGNIFSSDRIYGGAAKLPGTQYVYLLTPESREIMAEIIALMSGESDETADDRVFPLDDLEGNPVAQIRLQNGNNGNSLSFDSAEDIEWFVSRLKALTYTETEEIPATDGWTYRIIIDRAWGQISHKVSTSYVYESKNYDYQLVYYLTPESKEIMEEIIARMPD